MFFRFFSRSCGSTSLAIGAAVTLAALGMSAQASASEIGINFTAANSGSSSSYALTPTDTAGVSGVAQSNWNNLSISDGDANGISNAGGLTAGTAIDSTGTMVTGLSVAVAAASGGKVYPTVGDSWGFSGSNLTMQEGEIYPQPEITVLGVPYSSYDVYVYATAGSNGGTGSATISIANGASGTVDPSNTYWYNYGWEGGSFVQSTATTSAANTAISNYIVFTGNTTTDFSVAWNGTLSGGWTGISAMQIVATPEPTTLGLMGLGGLGVVLVSRKHSTAK
ncbi:MAG: PEP-CTERM sorting domain-containing protein [Phycisphaerae bacterium]|nr:PEP-CTERM sorting domain-containing protein [Phycisphaerae bacterium]